MDYYTDEQFKEILTAKRKGINLTRLMNPDLTASQMREIRLGEIAGIDTTLYASKDISAEKMRMTRKFLIKGLPISEEQLYQYNEAQLNEIRLGEKFGLNTKEYGSPRISAKQMKSMRLLLLTNKVIEFFKEKSIDIIHYIEDSLSTVQEQVQLPTPTNMTSKNLKAEKVQSIVLNAIKALDLEIIEDIEYLSYVISNNLINDNDLLGSLRKMENSEPEETVKGTFEILKTVAINDESFAVIRNVETNQFYTVNHYKDVDEASATWTIEKEFNNYENANISISKKIMETENDSIIKDANIVVNENPVSFEESDSFTPNLKITQDTSVHELLNFASSPDDNIRLQVAAHANTSPSTLSRLSVDGSENVVIAALKNKNIPTSVLKAYIASDAKESIKEHAKTTLLNRDDNENTKVIIPNNYIVNKIKPKSKEQTELTIVNVPLKDGTDNKGTIIVPSFAIKKAGNDQSSLSINESRNYELRINNKDSIILDGKTIANYYSGDKQKSASLNDRIKKAKEKQIKSVPKEVKELDKEKER